jgi:hypothetical protein
MEIRSRGAVDFDEAGDWVTSVGEGGLLTVEERDGGSTRRIEFRPGQGGPRVRYFVNGDERALDASGRAWAQRLVLRAVRESGLGAERRVARIRARSGVNGVLAEIARLETDVGRRMYYRALLNSGAMSTGEFARVMEDVGRMGSDVERRIVLTAVADERLADGPSRDAFFRAVSEFDSDVERRIVLTRLLRDAPEATAISAIQSAGQMGSDVEKRIVLTQVPSARLRSPRVAAAYRRAADGMGSDTERRMVLRHLESAGR